MGEMDGAVAGITKQIHFQISLLVQKQNTIQSSKTEILTLTIASIVSEKQTDTKDGWCSGWDNKADSLSDFSFGTKTKHYTIQQN